MAGMEGCISAGSSHACSEFGIVPCLAFLSSLAYNTLSSFPSGHFLKKPVSQGRLFSSSASQEPDLEQGEGLRDHFAQLSPTTPLNKGC